MSILELYKCDSTEINILNKIFSIITNNGRFGTKHFDSGIIGVLEEELCKMYLETDS